MKRDLKSQVSKNSGLATGPAKRLGVFLAGEEQNGIVVQRVDVTAAANATAKAFSATYNMRLLAVIVRATAAAATSTLQLRLVTTAITDAVVCAVDTTQVFASTITDAGQVIVAGTEYNLLAAGTNAAAVRAEAYLIGYRTSTDFS